jgi:hypothetical protein
LAIAQSPLPKSVLSYSCYPTLDATQINDVEELEIIKHHFDGFERDINSTASKVVIIGNQARTLAQNDRPNAQEILDRINRKNVHQN